MLTVGRAYSLPKQANQLRASMLKVCKRQRFHVEHNDMVTAELAKQAAERAEKALDDEANE